MSFITRIMERLRSEPPKGDVLHEFTQTYEIGENDSGNMYIWCYVCKMKSFHPEDIKHMWCASCNQYHPVDRRLVKR